MEDWCVCGDGMVQPIPVFLPSCRVFANGLSGSSLLLSETMIDGVFSVTEWYLRSMFTFANDVRVV
jgi:hypothetical protein